MKKPAYEQLRVIASPDGIVIQDANRRAIPNVFGVNMAIRPGKPPVMQFNLMGGSFDVAGVPTFMIADPAGGQPKAVKSIEFWDGEGIAFPQPPAADLQMQPPAGGAPSADPTGVRPLTPALPIVRHLVDVPEDAAIPVQPIDLPAPPPGKRWETDDELRDRALSIAQGIARAADTGPDAPA